MNLRKAVLVIVLSMGTGAGLGTSAFAQEKATTPKDSKAPAAGQPSEAEVMAQMMALAKPGENHKVLAELVGTWKYHVKFWMAPNAPCIESDGVAVRKPVMGGRYFQADVAGKMQMPGPDGSLHAVDFEGMSIDGYDNTKQKFVSSWIDNMGTSILASEGTYDPASKTFTYLFDEEMVPGVKTKVRQTVKVLDKDHHLFEWFETRGGAETKTMEISYTRQE